MTTAIAGIVGAATTNGAISAATIGRAITTTITTGVGIGMIAAVIVATVAIAIRVHSARVRLLAA